MSLVEYKVWDRTTRIFHWINVLCVLLLIGLGTFILNATALGASNDGKLTAKTIHVYVGYVFCLNLAWRLVWAFAGTPYARWRALLPVGPEFAAKLAAEIHSFNQVGHQSYVGHSPLGRISIAAMFLVLVLIASTGLFIAGTNVYMPPFGSLFADMVKAAGTTAEQVRAYAPETVDPEAYARLKKLEKPIVLIHEYLYFVILALIALHVAAVVFKEIRHGGNLISAMFTGRKAFKSPPKDMD